MEKALQEARHSVLHFEGGGEEVGVVTREMGSETETAMKSPAENMPFEGDGYGQGEERRQVTLNKVHPGP